MSLYCRSILKLWNGVYNEQKSEKLNFVIGLYDWALLYQVFMHPCTYNIYQINKNVKASQTERYV